MKEILVSFQVAKLAKEKGCELKLYNPNDFEYTDEDGNVHFTNTEGGISGKENTKPKVYCTQSLLQKWLREKRNIYVTTTTEIYVLLCGYEVFKHEGKDKDPVIIEYSNNTDLWDLTYEEALEKGLQEALKLI